MLLETVERQFPKVRANGRDMTRNENDISEMLIAGFVGMEAPLVANAVEKLIGPDCWNTRPVCIPFVTRNGTSCTLYGGWIHANNVISWDVLTVLPDGDAGCLDQIDEREFRDGMGLECVPTVDLIRILRNL